MTPIYAFGLLLSPETLFRDGPVGIGVYLMVLASFFAIVFGMMQIPGCNKVAEFFLP